MFEAAHRFCLLAKKKSYAWHKRMLLRFGVIDRAFLRGLFLGSGILGLFCAGCVATAHNALATLRVTAGMVLVLCFLRCPYALLLAWASINVCIGSSLTIFNGNNLDMVLLVPALCLLPFMPWGQILQRLPALLLLMLYMGWVLAGIGLSPLGTQAFFTFWLTMLASVAMCTMTMVCVATRRRLLCLIDALLITALVVALYGIYGFLTHQRGEVDPETHLFRVMGWFTQATTFAFYLSLVIPLALYRLCFLHGRMRLLFSGLALCLLAALLLTFTRSAYVGVLVEFLVMAWSFCARPMRARIVVALSILCGLAFVLGWSGRLPFVARFFNGDILTLNGRIYLWQALLSHFQFTQWLGNGLQSSDALLAALRIGDDGRGVIGSAPHNLYLGTLYDHGWIGLSLLLAFFLALGCSLIQGIRRSKGERRMLYTASLAALGNVLLQSLLSRDIWIQAVGVSFWITLALPYAACWAQREAYDQHEPPQHVLKKGVRSFSDQLPVYYISD